MIRMRAMTIMILFTTYHIGSEKDVGMTRTVLNL
jgi:hypothetical protein